jgi:hypothetical protein
MPSVTISRAISDGLRILKEYFWPCILIVIILFILDSFGQGSVVRSGFYSPGWWMDEDQTSGGFLAFIIAACMCIVGLMLLFVGIFPAVGWIKGMFASFYQQVIDVHDEEFLRSLDIEP